MTNYGLGIFLYEINGITELQILNIELRTETSISNAN